MSLCSANTVGVDRSHLSENAFIPSFKSGFHPKIVFNRDGAVAREVFACSQNVVRFKATNTQRRIDGVFTRDTSSDRPDAFAVLVFTQRRTDGFPLVLRLKARRDHLPESLLHDIAARIGVRMKTLRTQQTSVLAKTGTPRQAQPSVGELS